MSRWWNPADHLHDRLRRDVLPDEIGDGPVAAAEIRCPPALRVSRLRSDERRALARELHDEFGQNLTAILAFATTIEASAGDKYAAGTEIAQDARMISQATRRIIACPCDTLNRLRHPPAEELALEASLVDLVDSWRSRTTQPLIQLDLHGDLADISGTVAATAYRIAQECLTNALSSWSAWRSRAG
nr:histidine kinase [Bradyrhizobium embrapense]